jgi:glycosyltransferase involved in cell wall biosynthesis
MITVLYLSSVQGNPNGAAQSLFDLIESVKDEVKPIVLCRGEGDIYNYYINHGIECYISPYTKIYGHRRDLCHYVLHPWHLRFIKNFRNIRAAARMLKKELSGRQIDIVHSNELTIDLGYYLAKSLKAKHVWHIREYLEMGTHMHGRVLISLSRLKHMLNQADARIVISKPCMQHWELKKENTWMLWDAVRSVKDCCYVKEKQPYVLFCSYYLYKGKGPDKAIAAYGMSKLFVPSHDNEAPIRLKLIGKCKKSYREELMALAESYGCAEYVDFIPVQEDVKPFFAQAKAYINPSVNEGMGRTTAEAMFFGCPVIAHASGGTLDLVRDGETGYLFNTVEECAELMRKVCIADQEEMILRAQEFVKVNLSIDNYGKKLLEVYNSVL